MSRSTGEGEGQPVSGAVGPADPLVVAVRRGADALDAAADAADLIPTLGRRTPFHTAAWARAWWDEFGRGPRWAASRSPLHVVTVRRGPRLVGWYPMLVTRLGVGPLGLRMVAGVGHESADYAGPVVDPGDGGALGALADHLVGMVGEGRTVVNLGRLVVGDPFLAALEARAGRERLRLRLEASDDYPYLDLRVLDDPAGAVRRLAKANDVLRRRRRLAETGELEWVWHHPDPAGAGLDAFFGLHDRRWAGRDASGPFTSGPGRRFVRAVAEGLERLGVLRVSLLTLDGSPIAARFGAVHDRWYYGMKSAWDPALAAYGPGHLLVAGVLEEAVAAGLDGFDFLRGSGAHKRAWTSTARTVGHWTLGRDDRRAELDHRLLWAILRARYRYRDRSPAG